MKMNILLFTFTFLLSACNLSDSQGSQEQLVWMVDLDKAVELSNKTGKPIMANFTGSDWCGWCKRLKREVFDTPEFKAWAADNVILLELDFPRKTPISDELRQQNRNLQYAFGVRGYPTIHFFTADRTSDGKYSYKRMAKSGYVQGGPTAWITDAESKLSLN